MEHSLLGRFLFRNLDGLEKWEAIDRYNAAIADRLPAGAKALAFAKWHYNASDMRCPHDSWIQSIELKTANSFGELRGVLLRVLGAYHDRWMAFDYSDVTGAIEHLIEFESCILRIVCTDFTVTHVRIGQSWPNDASLQGPCMP